MRSPQFIGSLYKERCGVCSTIEFHAFVVRYRAKEMVEKACCIIVAVDEFRLLIQVSSLDDREYRHRCNAPESREASF
jgi:hypothetical protein